MRTGALKRLRANGIGKLGDGLHADGGGLYVRVRGQKIVWIFRYTWKGRKREMGFGSAATVSLATAREKADEARQTLALGADPLEARAAAEQAPVAVKREVPNLRKATLRHLQNVEHQWSSPGQRRRWESSLDIHAAGLLERQVDTITIADMEELLRPIWVSKPDIAGRVRGRIEKILAGCIVRGEHPGPNPATWRGSLEVLLAKPNRDVVHRPMVPVEEAPFVYNALIKADTIGARANILIAHTCMRSGEARLLEWQDVRGDMIVVPAERMKMKRDHRVPVTVQLNEFLDRLPRFNCTPLILPGQSGTKPMSDMTAAKALKAVFPAAVPHGWRSTFRTWALRQGYDRVLAEDQLAHKLGETAVEQAYLRGDLAEERREMCSAWSDFIAGSKR